MLDVRRQALRKARNDRPHWVPQTRPNNKHIVTIAERSLRNHEVLEFVGHEGYYVIFRGTHLRRAIVRNTVLGSITEPTRLQGLRRQGHRLQGGQCRLARGIRARES